MDNKTLAKSVGDLIERTIERVSPRPRRAIVTGVSGNTIQVSRNGPGIPVQELIEVVGIVPAVGDVVVVEKDEAGLYYAYSLASRSVGVGTAGSLPTASDVQNNLGMQTAYTVQNSGVAVRTGPTFLNFRNGLTAAVSGLGAVIDVLFGGSGGKSGVANSVARFDHSHSVSDAYDYNGGAGSTGQVLTKNSTGWAPATIASGSGNPPKAADWPRSDVTSISSSTFAFATNTSATLSGLAVGQSYTILLQYGYNALPAASGSISFQPVFGSNTGGIVTLSGANIQAAFGAYTMLSFIATSSSVTFGVYVRSNGGTHSLRNGSVSVAAIPNN